jgi:UDP-3-O-[3-hydroxymyristoyl] N-acetylglucosamine deacetylase
MIYQRTLAKEVKVTGIGLHSGRKVTMKLLPADADFGIQFIRTDITHAQPMKANALTVGTTENATTLGSDASAIHTVEHLLATLYGLGINNTLIEIDGPEVPIMDGSGASFVFLLKETGIKNLNKSKKFLVILDTVRVEKDGKWAQFEPHHNLLIDSTIVFAHPVIKTQQFSFEFSCESFIHDIARARTFGFARDVDMLKRKGLIKGGSLDNAVVMDDYKVVNTEGLRFDNEFVRHKILDTIGDVSLLGYEIAGKITTYKSGHNLHNLLCRKLLETPNAYEIVSASALKAEVREAHKLPQFITVTH